MAEKKETPRQKMIGMMYLVLTALLAMNVSKEVLMGFVTVNESLERTNKTFNESSETMMKYFGDYVVKYPEEKYYFTKAEESAKIAGEMFKYIEVLKKKLVETTEKSTKQQADTTRLRYVNALDNYDIPTYELFGDDEQNPSKTAYSAYELRQKLTETHDKIIKIFEGDEIVKKFLKTDLEQVKKRISIIKPVDPDFVQNGVKEDWQMTNFYHLPLAAVITNLSKIQADLKNVESESINTIAKSVMSTIPKIDQWAAAVVSPTNYIQMGDKYQSQIFLAAGSSSVKREILVGNWDKTLNKFIGDSTQLAMDANGRAVFEKAGGAQGEQSYKGVIKLTKETGEVQYYPFEEKYIVAPQSVAVSADNMNVVYAGIDNPISISAAGIAPKDLRVSSDNGNIIPTGTGKYNIKVMKGQEVNVSVSSTINGVTKAQGKSKFRVRLLPEPTYRIAGKGNVDKKITKVELMNATYLTAQPENFILNIPYVVKEYTVTCTGGGQPTVPYTTTGGKITPAMKTHFSRMTGGQIIVDAKAVSPDGNDHLGMLRLTIK